MADYFDAPLTDQWKQVDPKAPDLAEIRAARKWASPSQFGQGVLELCQMADIVFLLSTGPAGRTDGYRPPLISWAFPTRGRVIWVPAWPWTRT